MLSWVHYDVVIVGAGAAGLMCALQAGKRGRRVLLLDHNTKVGAKILISGGGRCNFTNTETTPKNFVSENEHFCKSALSRYTPDDFLSMLNVHKIAFHEKKLGQLFCDVSARDIVRMLQVECDREKVDMKLGVSIQKIEKLDSNETQRFVVDLGAQKMSCESLVIATGGLSIPKVGATNFGYKIAEQFGLKVTPLHPALDGFIFSEDNQELHFLKDLAGISIDCTLGCNGQSFRENILFTHKGLSGPAALQGSLYWRLKDSISINLCPDIDIKEFLLQKKKDKSLGHIKTVLSEMLPARFAECFSIEFFEANLLSTPLSQVSDKTLLAWAEKLQNWRLYPSGTVGYNKAEVTRGGVDTRELSSKNMESHKVQGLYFIGEVVDVTGWLGGYNFQWAWASGWAAAQSV